VIYETHVRVERAGRDGSGIEPVHEFNAGSGEAPTAVRGAMLLLEEGGGGIVFGLVLG
jgi:hypothetical protein